MEGWLQNFSFKSLKNYSNKNVRFVHTFNVNSSWRTTIAYICFLSTSSQFCNMFPDTTKKTYSFKSLEFALALLQEIVDSVNYFSEIFL